MFSKLSIKYISAEEAKRMVLTEANILNISVQSLVNEHVYLFSLPIELWEIKADLDRPNKAIAIVGLIRYCQSLSRRLDDPEKKRFFLGVLG